MAGLVLLAAVTLLTEIGAFASEGERSEVSRFRDYLKLNTAHPNPDYLSASVFIQSQAADIGLHTEVIEIVPKKPIIVFTWLGRDPTLPSIQLNSHVDVVPAEAAKWKHEPFDAIKDSDGNIFARGSQDMKSVGSQYLEAVRKLRATNFQPLRTIHITFVPDEEIGAEDGVEAFVNSDHFRKLNVGLLLDEGLASTSSKYRVFYGERSPWWTVIKAFGQPGHGSKHFDNSAAENLFKSLESIHRFRSSQFDLVKAGIKREGEVISVNTVFLKAGTPTPTGFVMNLQPSEASAGFDIRLPPTADPEAMEKRIAEEWAPASRNMTYKFVHKVSPRDQFNNPAMTAVDDSNQFWVAFKNAVDKAGALLETPEVFPAATDARFHRFLSIPALGFSPMSQTPVLLHDHNEFLNEREFLRGIEVYVEVIRALSTVGEELKPAEAPHSEL